MKRAATLLLLALAVCISAGLARAQEPDGRPEPPIVIHTGPSVQLVARGGGGWVLEVGPHTYEWVLVGVSTAQGGYEYLGAVGPAGASFGNVRPGEAVTLNLIISLNRGQQIPQRPAIPVTIYRTLLPVVARAGE